MDILHENGFASVVAYIKHVYKTVLRSTAGNAISGTPRRSRALYPPLRVTQPFQRFQPLTTVCLSHTLSEPSQQLCQVCAIKQTYSEWTLGVKNNGVIYSVCKGEESTCLIQLYCLLKNIYLTWKDIRRSIIKQESFYNSIGLSFNKNKLKKRQQKNVLKFLWFFEESGEPPFTLLCSSSWV